VLVASLLLGIGSPTTFAATPDEPRDITFTAKADGSTQRYVELLPPGFNAAESHDVLLAFHGHGSDRWQFIRDARGECRGSRDVAARFGMIFVSPDYRAKTSWMGPLAEADTMQIITELRQRHKVGRVFLVGGSMGGTSVLTFAALHPELVAGVCSLNGTANHVEYDKFQDAIAASFGGTKAQVPEEYKKRSAELWPEKFTMPVAFTTGGKDTAVPPQSVLRLASKLEQAGHKTLLIHREAGGHATDYADTVAALEFVLREADTPLQIPAGLTIEDQKLVREQLARLHFLRLFLRDCVPKSGKLTSADLRGDVDVFAKGATWAMRYEASLTTNDVALLKKALSRGLQRADDLLGDSKEAWTRRKGKVLRGFVSAVDGSTQPYGVIIPASYDGTKPVRLDVVLHGSSKPVGMSELKFGARFDEGDDAAKSAPDVDFIELHPLGRVENCYRWAGETDVFEAIEAVCRNYKIDRDRIVLRGMSMGASGTWHLGLKHPSRFVALGPYCGYVDTHRFSETPIPSFIKVGPLPPHQERGLHMLDSIDYAANASVVPAIGAIGDKDVFFQSHVHMKEVMAKEGLEMVNLISPGTGHTIDPVTHREQMRRIGEHVAKGLDHARKELRFVTWTLKYNRCHWLELLALGEHYERAEIVANAADDGSVEVSLAQNITQFAIHPPMLASPNAKVRIAGEEVTLPKRTVNEPQALVFALEQGKWKFAGPRASVALAGKRPGVQGPIDDAFASPFLCVRGTGAPWNPAVGAWADANLRRFAYEFARYMRGDVPVKNDTEVTEADVRTKHLILFGDPGSNPWIAKALPKLSVTWTRDQVKLGTEQHSAKDHAPVLISASPFPGAGDHYVVINSGHTFHEKEFAAFNYLLFPRHGDWAVMRIGSGAEAWKPGAAAFPEEVIRAGYFDEQWKFSSELKR
jgi:pimeloyl-ACP methyl ester carboxylesterase